MLSQPLNSLLPALARLSGRTLLLAFVLSLFFELFPINLGSLSWGIQISNFIVDHAFVAFSGVALLSYSAFVQLMPDPDAEPLVAQRLTVQRNFALRLCRFGLFSLALLALWQLPLMLGSTGSLNVRDMVEYQTLSPVWQKAEQSIRQASPAEIDLLWQRFIAAGAPGLKKPANVIATEPRRQILLAGMKAGKQQSERSIDSRGGQARFEVTRDTLRRVGLCWIYGSGFFVLRRSILRAMQDPRFPLPLSPANAVELGDDALTSTIQPPSQVQREPDETISWWD